MLFIATVGQRRVYHPQGVKGRPGEGIEGAGPGGGNTAGQAPQVKRCGQVGVTPQPSTRAGVGLLGSVDVVQAAATVATEQPSTRGRAAVADVCAQVGGGRTPERSAFFGSRLVRCRAAASR